ncbi:MAG: ABC transporter permease [Clostridia bacterium]|nr:ABC transporter permease [Clostridia bacterium]
MNNQTTVREPLFHVANRSSMSIWYKTIIYAVAIVAALFLGGIICSIVASGNPFSFFSSLFKGILETSRKRWVFFRDTALLICVSMALVPAFKMKFWNLGANGQILMGGLATATCMFYLGKAIDNGTLVMSEGMIIVIMAVASIAVSVIWSVIPALLKVFFNANETLLTLMMNYVATGLVSFCIANWVRSGSGTLPLLTHGNVPGIINQHFLIILVGIVTTVFMFIYLRFTKHGYELSVVGDSPNTARYVGMKVKKVVIRTMVLSGVICGIIGFLLVGAIGHTVGANTVNNRGFTAIMTTWLANCNPIFIVLSCLLVTFINKGMEQVRMDFGMTNDSTANLIIGIVYFFIIACAFFIKYRVIFRKKEHNTKKESVEQ